VHAERRGELRPNRWHFRRLVQERVADAECRGLQREALVPSPDLDPMRLVGGLADEYRDTGRAANLFSLFGLNNQPKASSPSQVGTLGFPVVAL
jgi:hypothetical protein